MSGYRTVTEASKTRCAREQAQNQPARDEALKKLARAMMERAISDLKKETKLITKEDHDEAARWIVQASGERGGFIWACQILGFNANLVKNRLMTDFNLTEKKYGDSEH